MVLSGLEPGQTEIEIVTGLGGGDCGYAFRQGEDYVVYADKNRDGRLETGICSRTRPSRQAAQDIAYFHAMANAPTTGSLRIATGYPGLAGKPGVRVIADGQGSRYAATTNAAGDAMFAGLPPGEYAIHTESDGDLPDDPRVQIHAKGCQDVTLFRALQIVGRVTTKSGQPAGRVAVDFRATEDSYGDGVMTRPDGRYEMRIVRPGHYHLGINLNHTASRETPYPRWFYPGTEDPALATPIDFSGKPEVRTYDIVLPDRQPEREIEGTVLTRDGQPRPRAVITAFDIAKNFVAQGIAGQDGRFTLQVFAGTPYRLYAVWPGNTPNDAFSAAPLDVQPGTDGLNLRLILTQPGNVFLEDRQHKFGN